MSDKTPSIGAPVYFFAPRFRGTIAAIITAIDFTDGDDTRHVSLTAFPPGQAPLALTSIQHTDFWNGPSHDLDGYWDWPS